MRVRFWALALPVVLGFGLSLECALDCLAQPPAQKASAKGSGNESPDAAVARGKLLLEKKQYALAIAAFTAALAKNDALKQAYLLRGDCEQALKKYADAASDYGQYSVLSPNDAGIYLRLSKVYGCLEKDNLALSYLSKAVVLNPRDGSLYTSRATLYDKLGKHAMAADDRTVAATLAKARTQPGKGVVITVAPPPKKASSGAVPNQNQDTGTNQPATSTVRGGDQPSATSNGQQSHAP